MEEKSKVIPFLIFIFSIILFSYIVNSFYVLPMSDDFHFAAKSRDFNFWSLQKQLHLYENGRYSALFLLTLLPKLIPLQYLVPSFLCFSLIFFSFSVYIFTRSVYPKQAFVLSFMFVSLFLNTIEGTDNGIFWFTGNLAHFFPLSLFLILFATLLSLTQKFAIDKYLFSQFLVIFIMGFNELILLATLALLFSFLAYTYTTQNKLFKKVLFLFIVSLFAAYFELFSKGNFTRMGAENEASGAKIIFTLYASFRMLLRYLAQFASSPWLLPFTVIFLSLPLKIIWLSIKPYMILIFSLLLIFSLFTPGIFSDVGTYARMVNTIYFIFIILWFYNLLYIVNYYNIKIGINKYLITVTLIILTASSFSGKLNSGKLISDLYTGKTQNFHKQLKKRMIILDKYRMQDTVQIRYMSNYPEAWGNDYKKESPFNWRVIGYKEYYKIEYIKYVKP